MNFKEITKRPIFKMLTNTYTLILIAFVIWMLFFDENSYLYHKSLDKDIKELEKWNEYHRQKISEDKEMIKKLQNPSEIQKYAREKYFMKKNDEDLFIIEFDTIK